MTTTIVSPHELTFAQWRAAERRIIRAEYPDADKEGIDLCMGARTFQVWLEFLTAAAHKGVRLRRQVLDSAAFEFARAGVEDANKRFRNGDTVASVHAARVADVRKMGEQSVQHWFGGVLRPGIEGWMPPTVRKLNKASKVYFPLPHKRREV